MSTRFTSWKFPLVLLIGVGGFWLWSRWAAHKQYQIQQVALIGPAISLAHESSGSWSLDWPEWHERKGDPVLIAEGLPYLPPGEQAKHSLQVRVEPPDPVTIGFMQPVTVNDWFEVGNRFDGNSIARIDRTRAKTIHYRVARADPTNDRIVVLRVEGSNDSSLLEGVLVGLTIGDVLAVLAAIPLLIWLGAVCIQRWTGRRKQTAIVTA